MGELQGVRARAVRKGSVRPAGRLDGQRGERRGVPFDGATGAKGGLLLEPGLRKVGGKRGRGGPDECVELAGDPVRFFWRGGVCPAGWGREGECAANVGRGDGHEEGA